MVHLSEVVVPAVPGATALPNDNVMSINIAYINNTGVARNLRFCTGSDDSNQLWVNSRRVLSNSVSRGWNGNDCQENTITFVLEGVTKLVYMVWEGGSGWNGNVRVLEEDGSAAVGIEYLAIDPGNTGQAQSVYSREAQVEEDPFNCPVNTATIVIRQTAAGAEDAAGDMLHVTEEIPSRTAVVSNISDGGSDEPIVEPDDGIHQETGAALEYYVLGPIANPGGAAPGLDAIRAEYLSIPDGDIGTLNEGDVVDGLTVRRISVNNGDALEYDQVGGSGDNIMHYAWTKLTLTEPTDVAIGVNADDSVQVLVNGEEVTIHNGGQGFGGFGSMEWSGLASLPAGTHTVLTKTYEGGGGHGVRLLFLRVPDTGIGPGGLDCATATPIAPGETGVGSTSGGDVGTDCNQEGSPAHYYQVVGTGARMRVETCNPVFLYDTYLALFTGDCAALVCDTFNDDTCGRQSAIEWDSVAGETYLIRVYGWNDRKGVYFLSVSDANTPAAEPIVTTLLTGAGVCASPDGGCDTEATIATGVRISWDVARSVLANGGVSYDITGATSPSHSGTVEEALEVVAISGVTTSPIALTTGPIASLDDSHDIGGVPTLGSSVVNGTTITVSGSGADIWDGNDRFQYAYKEVSGDFTATVRVTDVQDPPNDRWGRFGIMARYTCDNNSKYSFAVIPYRGEVIRAGNPQDSDARRHQSRRDHLNNGNTRDRQVLPGSINNAMGPHNGWIRLQRNGNYFWSSFAADVDGQPGTWHVAGGDYHQGEAPGSLLVGLVSSSHGSGGSNVMVVDYDNLTIETLDMPDMAIVKGDEVLLEEDFEAGLDPATIDVTSAGGNFTPAVVAGRLRVTVDGENDSRNAVHISADGLNLGDRAFCAEFDVFISGNPTEADGGVFAVTQGSFADSIGRVGGGGGAAGWNFGDHNENNGRRPSFAYEFDTWDGGHGDNDPPGGFGANRGSGLWHVGIDFNESITSAVNHVEFGVEDIFTLFNNADGAHMEVCYAPMGDQSLIQTWLTANDGSFERTLMGEVIGPRLNGDVYISITGATGGANETKEVDNIVITAACTENADSVSIAGAPAEPASEADLTAVVGGAEGDVTYAWSVEGDAAIVGAADGETVAIRCDGDGTATVTVTTSDAECGNSVDASIELQCLEAGLLLVPGDTSGDGVVDTTDVIRLAGFLFVDSAANSLPCEGIHTDPGNLALLDFNGSGAVDIADLSAEAGWLFLGTPAHVLNTAAMGPGCTLIADCELRAGLEDTAICTP